VPDIVYDLVREAVAQHARVTPLLPAVDLSERLGRDVWVKAECLQPTGSFKVRGAAARLVALDAEERSVGVVACSSGNHGRAVAYVAERMGIPASVYVPDWVDPVKLEGIRATGAEAVLAGATFDEAEAAAIEQASQSGRLYISAYDDPRVIVGQGTMALEVLEQLECAPAAFVVPLSGGGLAGGMAAALEKQLGSAAPQCVAVSAEKAAVMSTSVRAGHPVDLPEEDTLASALAGGIGLENEYSFALVRDLIEHHMSVTEAEIAAAMKYCVQHLHLVVEGGGAVGVAACLGEDWPPTEFPEGPIVIVLSGGNVATDTLLSVL
jgi:threonine dehydratase